MAPSLPLTEAEFEDLLERIRGFLRRVEREVGRLFDNVNRALPWLGPRADDVRRLLVRLAELVKKYFEEMFRFLTSPGVPWTLGSHGSAWTRIGGVTSGMVGGLSLDRTDVDETWQGLSYEAYQKTLPVQQKALEGIKAATDEIDDALTATARAIVTFWLAVASLIVMFIIEINAETGAAATVVGAPPAAAGASVSVTKILGGVAIAAATAAAYFTTDVHSKLTDLQQQLQDGSHFDGENWPRSTTDLSGGRSTGADDRDWRLR